ncbi:MAG: 2Fe-2S iron-sulfur cluster binding domain-containing protein [Candidatus Eremiobacteraeota bacterium]|nr:2Fe-2S iron-sulfur cluster binding domain-containing protein [Candidatus Eremiobacteraeota bacterium]
MGDAPFYRGFEEPLTRRRFVVRAALAAIATQLAAVPSRARAMNASVESETIVLNVNGIRRVLNIEPRVTLLDALRERLGLTGTKKGCDQGTCGACTVLVNGRRVDSCLTLAMMHTRDRIVTVEGIAPEGRLAPIQAAFIKHDGFQCGFCTPGQIVSAVALLGEGKQLDRETVRNEMSGNICRCGCYPHIVDAILEVAGP